MKAYILGIFLAVLLTYLETKIMLLCFGDAGQLPAFMFACVIGFNALGLAERMLK